MLTQTTNQDRARAMLQRLQNLSLERPGEIQRFITDVAPHSDAIMEYLCKNPEVLDFPMPKLSTRHAIAITAAIGFGKLWK